MIVATIGILTAGTEEIVEIFPYDGNDLPSDSQSLSINSVLNRSEPIHVDFN